MKAREYAIKARATDQIDDEGRVFAEPGDVGDVLGWEKYEDGTIALTVFFPNAPQVTTCVLGGNVEPA